MKKQTGHQELFEDLLAITNLKQQVYQTTLTSFKTFQKVIDEFVISYQDYIKSNKINTTIPFESKTIGEFEVELKFGGDILIFLMHSNIFEFPRDHEVMKTPYVKEDKTRSYHGIINIYNFLADSFKYNRTNDVGYMIGRVFINKDGSYFIEGKRELACLFNYFGSKKFDKSAMEELVETAIRYTINFDLLTPPYEQLQEVSVVGMKNALDSISFKTGKRLGFRFQADNQNVQQ